MTMVNEHSFVERLKELLLRRHLFATPCRLLRSNDLIMINPLLNDVFIHIFFKNYKKEGRQEGRGKKNFSESIYKEMHDIFGWENLKEEWQNNWVIK